MKKIIKATLFVLLFSFTTTVFAGEIDYPKSEWSPLYPDGLDSKFIESEVRYKWYKFENGEVDYTDEYYTELEGYTRDDKSAKTFYRYITRFLVLDAYNNIVYDEDYCKWNWCYAMFYAEPTLIDVSGKEQRNYTEDDIVEITGVSTPYTIDNGVYYFVVGIISILTFAIVIVTQKKKRLKRE